MVEPDKARELIVIALGEASMCWENLGGSGEFLSGKCLEIADQLAKDLGYPKHPCDDEFLEDLEK